MKALLLFGAFLCLAVGVAHSVLGERYILIRLFRRPDLPKLFGGTGFTVRTLRFAWHVTSIAWWGFACLLVLAADGTLERPAVLQVVAATFAATGLVAAFGSCFRHLSWVVFLAIAGIALVASWR